MLHNKLTDHLRSPSRQPSPQPTHLSVPGQAGAHTLVKEEGPGYVAPKFEGKEQQMEQGEPLAIRAAFGVSGSRLSGQTAGCERPRELESCG